MLKAENLHCVYTSGLIKTTRKTAVCGVDLEIFPGETVAIVGESGGCGKSTLAKLLVQQLAPASGGEVFFEGTKLTGMNWKNLRKYMGKIQLIPPQNPDDVLDPRWTVERSVAEPFVIFGGFSREEISAKVDALFAEVGLSAEHKTRYPHELSGGELQRVVIARALALKPEILVCDEATSMLDVSVQAFILAVLKEIQKKRGLGLVFITHDLEAAKAVSDRVLVMYTGEIVEEGRVCLIGLCTRIRVLLWTQCGMRRLKLCCRRRWDHCLMVFRAVPTSDCAGRKRTRVKSRRNYGMFQGDW